MQTRDGKKLLQSRVRDCVFDRIIAYMDSFGLELLWIDRHSVKQRECKAPCSHRRCRDKQAALQTSDLVFKLSNHPVALLGRPIGSGGELDLLARILAGKLVDGNEEARELRLSEATDRAEAGRALGLLREMTSDLWWTRAWTFQENYCAGRKMTLLIRHAEGLERQKRSYHLFGDVRGELCIRSVEFSREATRLCLAFRHVQPQTREEGEAGSYVLGTAGRYAVLLKGSDPMFATVVADVERRGVKNPEDRLSIAANCCRYPIRLNTRELQRNVPSLSLSKLAMCLLNGEILYNGRAKGSHPPTSQMTVSAYLETQFFHGFCSPRDEHSLTFNRGCRLISVELGASGIATKGHLWRLGRTIRTAEFSCRLPRVGRQTGGLTSRQQNRLAQLATVLRSHSHTPLADKIEAYLRYDSSSSSSDKVWNTTFPKRYMRMMATELASAIDGRKTLRLGSLWGLAEAVTWYDAIFVWEDGDPKVGDTGSTTRDTASRRQGERPAFVFTASRPKRPSSSRRTADDVDCHVSLEVELTGSGVDGPPRLHVKRWLPGLCFFKGYPRRDVIFPWPSSLEAVTP